jgi:hypothetical protein
MATDIRKYVMDFPNIAASMTDLLKDNFEKNTWTIDCHASFEALRIAMTEAPILRIMDP